MGALAPAATVAGYCCYLVSSGGAVISLGVMLGFYSVSSCRRNRRYYRQTGWGCIITVLVAWIDGVSITPPIVGEEEVEEGLENWKGNGSQ